MIRAGIIGPGLIWKKTHRSILAEMHDRIRVVAAAARSRERQRDAREAYPDATIYSDARKLIEDSEVEAVIILTPISLNAPMVRATLAAGKHAIVEKPVAMSVAEARDLFDAETRSAGTIYILEQHLYKTLIPVVQELIAGDEIGTLLSFERILHGRIALEDDLSGGYGSTPWRIQPDFPLGNFFDGGIHEVALLQEIFGPAQAVFARGRSLRPDFGEVDLLSMVVEYPQGVQGTFSYSSVLGRQGNSLVIHGTKAALVVRDRELHVRDPRDGSETLLPINWCSESSAMWEDILSLLPSGKKARYTGERAIADLGFMEAVVRSLASARFEPVES